MQTRSYRDVLVAILDFLYDEEVECQKLYRHAMMKDRDGEVFSKTIQMVFLQMPLFTLSESELITRKDKWLYFLKNLESFDEIPRILREPVFEKAFDTAEYIRMPPKMQDAYFASWKAYLDNVNTFQYALDQAEKEGNGEGTCCRVRGR